MPNEPTSTGKLSVQVHASGRDFLLSGTREAFCSDCGGLRYMLLAPEYQVDVSSIIRDEVADQALDEAISKLKSGGLL